MLSFLPSFIIFPIQLCLQILSLGFWALLIMVFGLIRPLIPYHPISLAIGRFMDWMSLCFGTCSVNIMKLFNRVEVEFKINGDLSTDNWYLMIPNHLSWLDIVLLFHFAHGRIPAPKFFLKKELIWLPFVGTGAWALNMPFMQRYSREFLKKNPHLKGKDIEATRKSCEKFVSMPTTVINFVEGSRFTEEKHALRNSEFKHLLPPKAGGIAFTLASMGELFTHLLDTTILYPNNNRPMMEMLSGKLTKITLQVETLPVDKALIGDYFNDEEFRQLFQNQLNKIWNNKDQLIHSLKERNHE